MSPMSENECIVLNLKPEASEHPLNLTCATVNMTDSKAEFRMATGLKIDRHHFMFLLIKVHIYIYMYRVRERREKEEPCFEGLPEILAVL